MQKKSQESGGEKEENPILGHKLGVIFAQADFLEKSVPIIGSVNGSLQKQLPTPCGDFSSLRITLRSGSRARNNSAIARFVRVV